MLYAVNEHEPLEPASVTKIMTILLVMEAIDSGQLQYGDVVTALGPRLLHGRQPDLAEGE